MTNIEFNNNFDVLYNNVTSNQAPGLNSFEKSVFLTKAQNEIIRSYFSPRTNKSQEGYDTTEKRQIDFSSITRTITYDEGDFGNANLDMRPNTRSISKFGKSKDSTPKDLNIMMIINEFATVIRDGEWKKDDNNKPLYISASDGVTETTNPNSTITINTTTTEGNKTVSTVTNSYIANKPALKAGTGTILRLNVVPISYEDYARLMSKPYKRPLYYQAWRLIDSIDRGDNNEPDKFAEIIIGPNDILTSYSVRYVKRPRAIILENLDPGVTLDGSSDEQSCELDEVLHEEILQRAVELAKAAYTGGLQEQLALGQNSQTGLGPGGIPQQGR